MHALLHATLTHRSLLSPDVKTATTKDDILFHLSNLRGPVDVKDQLADKIRNDDTNGLVRSLHQQILFQPLNKAKWYYSMLDNKRRLHVTVLCSVIERLLYCSRCPRPVVKCNDDFAASLPRIVVLFARATGCSAIRSLTIGNCIRVMLRLSSPFPQTADRFIESLLPLVDQDGDESTLSEVPSDLLTDTARAIARFVVRSKSRTVLASVEAKASTLITNLETALSSPERRQFEGALEALAQISQISSIASQMSKRRVLVYAVCKHLSSIRTRVRKKAVVVVGILLASYNVQRAKEMLFESNLELITNAVTKAALRESNLKLQKSMFSRLCDLVNKKGLDSEIIHLGMKSLLDIALSDTVAEEVSMESAVAYLVIAKKVIHSEEVLSAIVQFTTSLFAKVRKTALALLQEITFWDRGSLSVLLHKTVMLECFGLILSHGSDIDGQTVLKICRQLLFEKCNHAIVLQSSAVVSALVDLVTKDPGRNRTAYVAAFDLLLELLEDDGNLAVYFLQYNELLPWLIKTCNRTTDESIKQRLIPLIIRFSVLLLDE